MSRLNFSSDFVPRTLLIFVNRYPARLIYDPEFEVGDHPSLPASHGGYVTRALSKLESRASGDTTPFQVI